MASIVRELHVYGSINAVSKKHNYTQHSGLGKKLMEVVENISRNLKIYKIAVISAIGTRGYYKKIGYSLKGTYMVKEIQIVSHKKQLFNLWKNNCKLNNRLDISLSNPFTSLLTCVMFALLLWLYLSQIILNDNYNLSR